MKTTTLPPLYAILDAESCDRRGLDLFGVAQVWRDAGVRLVQYRDKPGSDETVLRNARRLRLLFGPSTMLILNDRVHLFRNSGCDGVHVGQGDVSVSEVRQVIGPDAMLGLSTHNAAEAECANALDVTYVAVGPVFATTSKDNAAPVVGLDGVRLARSLTKKPLVAIGGITAATAPAVLNCGANSVAVISALLDGSFRDFRGLL